MTNAAEGRKRLQKTPELAVCSSQMASKSVETPLRILREMFAQKRILIRKGFQIRIFTVAQV
jgi:hypothetical protein